MGRSSSSSSSRKAEAGDEGDEAARRLVPQRGGVGLGDPPGGDLGGEAHVELVEQRVDDDLGRDAVIVGDLGDGVAPVQRGA